MLIGEAPCTNYLIEITDRDFTVVSWVSIAFVFLIIALTLRSASIPVILVAVIEFAVFINLGIPYYTKASMPFIAPICISTIQLGSTVDYAILMTTHYRELRRTQEKRSAVTGALTYAMPSVLVSALSFFAATFGVALYSDIDIVGSMCMLLARGAIISVFMVIFALPALLLLCDRIVCATTLGMRHINQHKSLKEASSK
jgi:predicted RND superfamily exporter protein